MHYTRDCDRCSRRKKYAAALLLILSAFMAGVVAIVTLLQTTPAEEHLAFRMTTTKRTTTKTTMSTNTEPPATPAALQSSFEHYSNAAVTTASKQCSAIAREVLSRNGATAVDAAIAAILCIGVVNPHSSGIGGGAIMTVYQRPRDGIRKIMKTLTFRETAPATAHKYMFKDDPFASQQGGTAIAVPSEVKGLYQAWKMFGHTPWKSLILPAINMCNTGVEVTASLARALKQYEDVVRQEPEMNSTFINADGSIKKEGDIMTRPKLAITLQKIADEPMSFYKGPLAKDVLADIQDRDGIITAKDLKTYRVRVERPITSLLHTSTGNVTVYSPGTPSSGVVYQFILNILDGYSWTKHSIETTADKILSYHRIAEAFKFAYAMRSYLGDGKFINLASLVPYMTSDGHAKSIRDQITNSTHNVSYYGSRYISSQPMGTAHVNVVAPDGSAVAITSTINTFFGSKVKGSRTGIIFNNEMDDFSNPNSANHYGVPPSPSNFIEPGKMPMSAMTPTIMLDDKLRVRLVTGGAGGTRIITHAAFVACQYLYFGLPIREATDAPRLHHQLLPNVLEMEESMETELQEGLLNMGHVRGKVEKAVVQSIANDCYSSNDTTPSEMCLSAVTDYRKGGSPDGF